ncbi:unnamed protein product [Brassicogethes aeneus]|uniref:P21-activated protein kinase-interacting protein 1-like n=1 Tax=Brassicogethes aeneus TaxID=1431903 RepID=A0A9P0AT70_BRAAE|nr:unnamed protein product [Brassicogethes aeneus]
MSKQANFEVIVGTYEEYLLGYNFIAKSSEIIQSFAAHDHSSSVRSLAHAGNFLASGGADDRIFIYDLKVRKEHCMLTHHNSTVTCLQFTENHSHILSGSNDGVLAIVRTGNWQLEKIWEKPHNGAAILDIAVHSSGKLALTLGSDCSLRTWNLVKGRQAYIINLMNKSKEAKSLEKIAWGPDGIHFVLYGGKNTEVWSIESGGIIKSIEHETKVCTCIWGSDKDIIVGLEDGNIVICTFDTVKLNKIKAHESRVKCVVAFKEFYVSGSSTGEIKVWNKEFEELAKHETGCRITCLCIVPKLKTKVEEPAKEIEPKKVVAPQQKPRTKVIVEIEESDEEIVEKPTKKNKRKSNNGEKTEKLKKKKTQIEEQPKKKKGKVKKT